MFVSIIALVTFAVSHLRLAVHCVSLKCVIAASQVAVSESVVSYWGGEWPIFKNVFVVKSEMLIVDECAAPEEQNPSARRRGGNGGWDLA